MSEPTPHHPLLLAEDVLLLLLDDHTGTLQQPNLAALLGGAVLAELAIDAAVRVGERQGLWRTAKVHPVAGVRPQEPLLASAQDVVAERPRTAQDLVNRLGKPLRDHLCERLAARGILRREEHRVIGLFPTTRWPAADSRHEEGVRRRLADVLLRGLTPDPRTVTLVALLSAVDRAHKVVDREGLSSWEVRKRAKRLADTMDEGDWAAEAVRDAVRAAAAAVTAGAVAAGTAAGSS